MTTLAPAERARAIFELAWGLPPAEQRRRLADLAAGGAPDADAAREALLLLDEPVDEARFLGAPLASPSLLDEPAPDTFPLPDRIGPYTLRRTLGEGASAVVALAEQEHPVRRLVAIKVMRTAAAGGAARRFDWERQILARLEHPGIARFIDAGSLPDGRPYFIMEYVEGEPITRIAAALPLRERLALLRSACEAVEHAHRNGVIHRDLKPQNILAPVPPVESVPPTAALGGRCNPSLDDGRTPHSQHRPCGPSPAECHSVCEKTEASVCRPEGVAIVARGGFAPLESGPINSHSSLSSYPSGVSESCPRAKTTCDLNGIRPSPARSEARAVKVIDFGISRPGEQSDLARATFTQQGILVGTPAYMSPERLGAGAAADARADVYALGVILHELACGRLPFSAPDLPSLIAAVVTGRRPRPRTLAPQLSKDLEAVIDKALAANPAERYQTVAALREDLERLETGRAVSARRESAATALLRAVRRRPVTAAAAAAGMLLIAGLAANSWARAKDEAASYRAALTALGPAQSLAVLSGMNLIPREERLGIISEGLASCSVLRALRPHDAQTMAYEAALRSLLGTYHLEGHNLAAAEQQMAEALRLFATIEQRAPSTAAGLDHYTATVRLGDVYTRSNRDHAWALYARAEAHNLALIAADPHDLDLKVALAWGHERMAEGPHCTKDEARTRYLKMLDLGNRVAQQRANDPGIERLLCAAHFHLGDLARERATAGGSPADWREAMRHYEPSVAHARRAVELAPTDRECRRFLIRALGRAACGLQGLGDRDGAVALQSEGLALVAPLSLAHPGDEELALQFLDAAHGTVVAFEVHDEASALAAKAVLDRALAARAVWTPGVLQSRAVRRSISTCLFDRLSCSASDPASSADWAEGEALLRGLCTGESAEEGDFVSMITVMIQAARWRKTDPEEWRRVVTEAQRRWPASEHFIHLDPERPPPFDAPVPSPAPPSSTPAP